MIIYFLHFTFFIAALMIFTYLLCKGRLDMNEKPKHQIFEIPEDKPDGPTR